MKRWVIVSCVLGGLAWAAARQVRPETPLSAQAAQASQNLNVPKIPFDSVPDYLKYPATMNL